ncbi:MAG: SpoIIE family protein phosphatase [Spirochaetaceae bacterium]|nr:SpoIIE family protein phosphatase [Spirochaetaceae bacterium]
MLELQNIKSRPLQNITCNLNMQFSPDRKSHCVIPSDDLSKSIFLETISGWLPISEGQMLYKNKRIRHQQLRKLVSICRDTSTLCESHSGYDNLTVAASGKKFHILGFINKTLLYYTAQKYLDRIGIKLDLKLSVHKYTPSQKAGLEIVKVLLSEKPILVFSGVLAELTLAQCYGFSRLIEKICSPEQIIILIIDDAEIIKTIEGENILLKNNRSYRLDFEEISQQQINEYKIVQNHNIHNAIEGNIHDAVEKGKNYSEVFDECYRLYRTFFCFSNPVMVLKRETGIIILHQEEPDRFDWLKELLRDIKTEMREPCLIQKQEHFLYIMKTFPGEWFGFYGEKEFLVTLSDNKEFQFLIQQFLKNIILLRERARSAVDKAEIEFAGLIQRSIFQKNFSQFGGFDIHALSKPAKSIGGDYYEIIKIDENRIFCSLFDVSGKGIAAGMVVFLIRNMIKTIPKEKLSPAMVFNLVNKMLYDELNGEKFATGFSFIYDKTTRKICLCNGGHSDNLLVCGEKFSTIQADEIPIGISDETVYKDSVLLLPRGSLFIAYTDGVVEARNTNKEEFGKKKLVEVITQNKLKNSKQIIKNLDNSLINFTKDVDQFDDITFLVLRT